MDLKHLVDLSTILGATVGIGALAFAGVQLRRTLNVERGRFLLELQRMIDVHNAIHLRLRPGGDWAAAGKGPANAAETVQLEDYMAFFELCEELLEAGSLDPLSFKAIFGYRLTNILRNRIIVDRVHANKNDWQRFLALTKRLGLKAPS